MRGTAPFVGETGLRRWRLIQADHEYKLSRHAFFGRADSVDPAEARRILSCLEFHYTPKHASWLNMVEIEIGVMVNQCLDRRIADKQTLITEVTAWERRRNTAGARIDWMFTVERAREKLGRAYPRRTSCDRRALRDEPVRTAVAQH